MTYARIIGAGPAGLMAAEVLAQAGCQVAIADQMPSPARKFLMAGKSGLNLTKDEPLEDALDQVPMPMHPMMQAFGPDLVRDWAQSLGIDLFTGSSGRVFPVGMKASPLVRAWLGRLGELGVRLDRRWRWTGWTDQALGFETPDGAHLETPDLTVLALGGGSWGRLGSDGAWADWVPGTRPFRPVNVALHRPWSRFMDPHYGAPLKNVVFRAGKARARGECVITARGLEGGGLYPVTKAVADGAPLTLDLKPDLTMTEVQNRLNGKQSTANKLRRLGLTPAQIALVQEKRTGDLAVRIKALMFKDFVPGPLDGAISTAGGLGFDALDDGLMLRKRPGVFAAGEMLDWAAPTGGYLITGCLATGRWAGLAAARHAGLGS